MKKNPNSKIRNEMKKHNENSDTKIALHHKKITSNYDNTPIDKDDLEDLQIFFDEIRIKYGINIKINKTMSAYDNEVIAQKKCEKFWHNIFRNADIFLKTYKSFPASYTTQEDGERSLNTENLENFIKMKFHPFSVIVIANAIQNKSTNIDEIKNDILSLDNEIYSGISTIEFADKIRAKSESIRVRLCNTGNYFGIKPYKLPNGRLLWPIDEVNQFINKKKPKKS